MDEEGQNIQSFNYKINMSWGVRYSMVNIDYAAAAAAAAKLLQCPTLCNPREGSPPGSPSPGILQARILEWVANYFSNALK